MSELMLREFDGFQIRVQVDKKGVIWFVAQDVCLVLGLKYQAHALRGLDEDQRGGVIIQGEGGNREFAAITEPGLYELIFKSKTPTAKKFRRWVTHDLLPTLRANGSYSMQPVRPYVEVSTIERLEMHLEYMKKVERQEIQLAQQKRINDEVAVKMLTLAHEARQENDTLTADQIGELDCAISKRARELGDVKVGSRIKRAIKNHFFEIRATRTYKEIPRRGFQQALHIAAAFEQPAYALEKQLEFTQEKRQMSIIDRTITE